MPNLVSQNNKIKHHLKRKKIKFYKINNIEPELKQGQDTVNVLVCPCVGMRVCVCKKVLCLVSPCVGMRVCVCKKVLGVSMPGYACMCVQESTLLGKSMRGYACMCVQESTWCVHAWVCVYVCARKYSAW